MRMSKRPRKKPAGARNTPGTATTPQVGTPPHWPVITLATLGVLLTGYLALSAWTQRGLALCNAGSSCDAIQQSQWSTLLGLPLAAWGFGLYALIALVAFLPGNTPLARWRHLWRLSLLGLVISVFLTLVGMITLRAVCAWCLLSLATLAALFLVLHLRRPNGAPGTTWHKWWLGNGALALLVVAGLAAYHGADLIQRPENPQLQALAVHLEQSGAKYYGASWCQNCRKQTREFGPSAHRLPYVECSPGGPNSLMIGECTRANVTSFPTWVIDGNTIEGVQSPEQLAQLSGFEWQP